MTLDQTQTGLDFFVQLIVDDPILNERLTPGQLAEAAAAANTMNHAIVEAIFASRALVDGVVSSADVFAIHAHLQANFGPASWGQIHGQPGESGFALALYRNDATRIEDAKAINHVANKLYDLGFELDRRTLLDESGERGMGVDNVAKWLNYVLADDIANGSLVPPPSDVVGGTTGTGLDRIVDIILTDEGLALQQARPEVLEGALAADSLNQLYVDAIFATGVANDGRITSGDIYDLVAYVQSNAYDEFVRLHGNDFADGTETGFHKVNGNGSTTILYDDRRAIDAIADSIYHIGFPIVDGRLLDEDGNPNLPPGVVASWLNELLAEDIAAGTLTNPNAGLLTEGTTGTGLDRVVQDILTEGKVQTQVSTAERDIAARAADGQNHLIIEAIETTGIASDGDIDATDIRVINSYLLANHADTWRALHGTEIDGVRSAWHLAVVDGASSQVFGEASLNYLWDGVLHIGFEIDGDRVLNARDEPNRTVDQLSRWLNLLLKEELFTGYFSDEPTLTPASVNAIIGDNDGNDLVGTDGDDILVGLWGTDSYDGKAGTDTVDFSYTKQDGWVINLRAGTAVFRDETIETLRNIENIVGTRGDDRIIGNGDDNLLMGHDGNDILIGGFGRDTFDGGRGRDTVDFSYSRQDGTLIDLARGVAEFRGGTREQLINIEDVIGSRGDDTIVGDAENNFIDGGAGLDTVVYAGDRSDYLIRINNDTGIIRIEGDDIGVDRLLNVEILTFADGDVFL